MDDPTPGYRQGYRIQQVRTGKFSGVARNWLWIEAIREANPPFREEIVSLSVSLLLLPQIIFEKNPAELTVPLQKGKETNSVSVVMWIAPLHHQAWL